MGESKFEGTWRGLGSACTRKVYIRVRIGHGGRRPVKLSSVDIHLDRHGVVAGGAWTHLREQSDVERPPLMQDVVVLVEG